MNQLTLTFVENAIHLRLTYIELNAIQSTVKLLVLSACQTAEGKIEAGEGTYSLSRSFLQSGMYGRCRSERWLCGRFRLWAGREIQRQRLFQFAFKIRQFVRQLWL